MNRQRPASGGGMKDGMVREWRIALDNGESRPATDDDLLAMQATLLLPMAEAKLRTFPPVKELHKQQKLLDRRADAIVAGIKAIDGPNKELKEQLAHSLIAVHDEIERVEKLERERGEEDELIRFLRFVIQRCRARRKPRAATEPIGVNKRSIHWACRAGRLFRRRDQQPACSRRSTQSTRDR
jgi:hypothetical protein